MPCLEKQSGAEGESWVGGKVPADTFRNKYSHHIDSSHRRPWDMKMCCNVFPFAVWLPP